MSFLDKFFLFGAEGLKLKSVVNFCVFLWRPLCVACLVVYDFSCANIVPVMFFLFCRVSSLN